MKIKEITAHLEQRFPLSLQEDFDNCGVQCGDIDQEVTGVLVCFEISQDVLDEAIAQKANLVISHHPILLKRGICKIEPHDRVGGLICKALAHNMVIYSMHTNVDSAKGGGNDVFAEKLDLQNIQVLIPHYANGQLVEGAGLGRIGELPNPMLLQDYLLEIKQKLNLKTLRYYGNSNQMINKVAVCGGGGSSFIENALTAGADVYITGDIKYHDFFRANRKMAIVDIGHYEGEWFIREILYKEIKENFTTFATTISKKDNLEIYYL